jgi:hypothetical protein
MSSAYLGYRLKFGDTIISNDLIQKGTYNFSKEKRILSTWKDAEAVEHQKVLPDRKVHIKFSLRERNLTEQESVTAIFATQDNITITYWDDYACVYDSSTFYMQAPTITHRNTVGGINYDATPIDLVEY